MVDYFDRLYTSVKDKNKFLIRIKFYSILRFSLGLIINILLPVYYLITRVSIKERLDFNSKTKMRLIISLTTFPGRINRIWIVIESLLRQKLKPDMIILWLAKEQFASIEKLPAKLLHQRNRGLEIRLCEGDLKSHKKYYYALKEFPDDILITVDDDIIYPSTMLQMLVELNKKYPSTICCHRARIIKTENKNVSPYIEWKEAIGQTYPGFNIFFTSGGGTLFPPNSFYSDVLNENIFMKYCFYADDIWLNIMSRLKDTEIVKSDYYSFLLPVYYLHNINLSSLNVEKAENDKQLKAVQQYYIRKKGIDAFNKSYN